MYNRYSILFAIVYNVYVRCELIKRLPPWNEVFAHCKPTAGALSGCSFLLLQSITVDAAKDESPKQILNQIYFFNNTHVINIYLYVGLNG